MTNPALSEAPEATFRAADLAKEVLSRPKETALIAFEHFVKEMRGGRATLTEGQRQQLVELLEAFGNRRRTVISGLTSIEYFDTRDPEIDHNAVKFELTLATEQNVGVLLKDLLGDDASVLMLDCDHRVNFDKNAPSNNQVILFRDSNHKARYAAYKREDEDTTQQSDFKAAGLEGFADELEAIVVCAALVSKAKGVGMDLRQNARAWSENQAEALSHLAEQETDLLYKLREGVVRTFFGGLLVSDSGRLRALGADGGSSPLYWAFGGAAQPDIC